MAAVAGEMREALDSNGFQPRSRREILTDIHREFDSMLRGFLASRLSCEADAGDIVQEVYLRIARYPGLHSIECQKAFVFQTAMNLLRDKSRRLYTRCSQRSVPIDEIDLCAHSAEPSEAAEQDEMLVLLVNAIAEMPPKRREALLLHRLHEMSYAQIASRMGVSVSMIEKHISGALADLRGILGNLIRGLQSAGSGGGRRAARASQR